MNENSLQSAFRAHEDCPSIETLAARLASPPNDPAHESAARHVRECVHCRTELDLLREFEAGTVRPEEVAAVRWISARLSTRSSSANPPKRRWAGLWSTPRIAGLATVLLIAVVAVGVSSEWRARRAASRPIPQFGNEVLRSSTIAVLAKPGSFAWNPVPGAARYDLSVRTVDGQIIFHNTFTSTALAFPPEVAEVIKTGKLLEWEVLAIDSAGNEIARSGVQRLRIPIPPAR